VLQCYRRQAIPMEQAKIRPSVTLYSLDRSSPNLVRLIMSATPTQMPVLVKFGWVGNSPQIGNRWNITSLWLFVVSFFSSNSLATKRVNGFARIMAQTREISQGCAFWGFRQKMVTQTPTSPQILKILYHRSRFRSKHV